MSLLSTMAQQMVSQLSPEERAGAARDVAISMIHDLSPQERTDLSRFLLVELLRDMTIDQRRQVVESALTDQEAN